MKWNWKSTIIPYLVGATSSTHYNSVPSGVVEWGGVGWSGVGVVGGVGGCDVVGVVWWWEKNLIPF